MLAVVQLDATAPERLDRLVAEGRLPRLAELRARGTHRALATPADRFAGASFHSLYNGVDVASHGLYYAFQWDAADQRVRHVDEFPAPPPVWERVAPLGVRSLVVDLYEARVPHVDGCRFLGGWQFRNRVALPYRSVPDDTAEHAGGKGARGPALEEIFGRATLGMLRGMGRGLRGSSLRAAAAVESLVRRERFDLVWVGLCSGHLAGHWLWNLSQLEGGDLEAARAAGLERALDDAYVELDVAVGRILDALPDDADVLLVSSLGMAENSSRSDLLPGMLEAVLDGRRDGATTEGDVLGRLRARVPTGFRGAVANALPRSAALELTAWLDLRRVDWSTTRAFALAGDHHGHVRLNLRGRERDGIVDPAEADELVERLTAGLLRFTDVGGGRSVERVDRTATFADGPGLALLPDLVVVWSDRPATRLAAVESPEHGVVVRPGGGSGTGRSGGHTGDAWVLAVPGGSSRHREPSRTPHVVDVAATAHALLGAPLDGLDGEPLLERAA